MFQKNKAMNNGAMNGNEARHFSLNEGARSPIATDDLYERFQDHVRFCKESLVVETESRALLPMCLSPGQLRFERRREQPDLHDQQHHDEDHGAINRGKSRDFAADWYSCAFSFHSNGH